MSDEATMRNLLAIQQHSNDSRKLVRELEAKINRVEMLEKRVEYLEEIVRSIQVKVFTGGPT